MSFILIIGRAGWQWWFTRKSWRLSFGIFAVKIIFSNIEDQMNVMLLELKKCYGRIGITNIEKELKYQMEQYRNRR